MSEVWPMWVLGSILACTVLLLVAEFAFLGVKTRKFTLIQKRFSEGTRSMLPVAQQFSVPDEEELRAFDSYLWWLREGQTELCMEVSEEDFRRYPVGAEVTVRYGVRRLSRRLVFRGMDDPTLFA